MHRTLEWLERHTGRYVETVPAGMQVEREGTRAIHQLAYELDLRRRIFIDMRPPRDVLTVTGEHRNLGGWMGWAAL